MRKDAKKLPLERPMDRTFKIFNDSRIAVSFNDVRIMSDWSEISPAEVNLKTKFTRNVGISLL